MKKVRGIIGTIFTLFVIIFASYIYATSVESSKGGYEITAYNVDIVVNEDNVLHITETIDVYFYEERHGIYRTIPLKGNITRADGRNGKYQADISNITVSEAYSRSDINGTSKNIKLQIGSSTSTIIGEHRYLISYDYSLGSDGVSKYDELYYNIIGAEWDTKISNVTFTIEMPNDDFDKSKIGFTRGEYGSTETSDIEYDIDGNKIIGKYNGSLDEYNGLTVRIELPEGYFKVIDYQKYIDYVVVAIFTIIIFIAFILWFIYGKEKRVVETVEFYPPDGMNSLEVGFAYKGEAFQKDVTSLLVYLASKGYLKIEEKNNNNSFKITKLKEYSGNNDIERLFFKELFATGDVVERGDLINSFYIIKNKILKLFNTDEKKSKIVNKKSFKKRKIIKALIVIIIIIIHIFVPFNIKTIESSTEDLALQFVALPFVIIFIISFMSVLKEISKIKRDKTHIIMLIIMTIFLYFPVLISDYCGYLELDLREWGVLCIGVISIIIMIIFYIIMPSRTKEGAEILAKINGFKRFLKTARKDELESLVEENPSYFYDILPYIYVLDISDKWIKKFESINVSYPDWYESDNEFSTKEFKRSFDHTMYNINHSIGFKYSPNSDSSNRSSSSSKSKSSSGGSSGGGCSGGGSGGGGGGSW